MWNFELGINEEKERVQVYLFWNAISSWARKYKDIQIVEIV